MKMENGQREKYCTTCKIKKPLSNFWKAKSHKDGLQSLCKLCLGTRMKLRYQIHGDRIRREKNIWRFKNRHLERKRDNERNKILRQQMLNAFGRKCNCCGETIEKFLTLEHKNRGGRKHIKKAGGHWCMLREIRKLGFPKDEYTILCMNCNFATRYGEPCPHVSLVKI